MKQFKLFNNAKWLVLPILAIMCSTQLLAAVTTGTINFGTSSGYTSINSTSVSGSDSQSRTWTVTTVFPSTTSFTPQPGYSQVGSSSTPATSVTFTATLASSQRITGFSAKFGGFSGTEADITLKVGSTVVGTGRVRDAEEVVVNCSSWLEGNSLTVIVDNIDKGLKCYYISYSYGETMYPITWRVNGGAASGSPTTSVPNGWKVTALPTTPTSANCDNSKVFVGWSASEIDGETNTRPSDLFSTPEEAPTVSAAATYYAVFATQTGSSTLLSENFASATHGDNTSTNNSVAWSGNSNIATVSTVYEAGGAVRLASKTYIGYFVTKQLTAAVGTVLTISFDVKGWDKVESDIEVSGNNSEFTAPPAIRYNNTWSSSFESKTVKVALTTKNPEVKIYSYGRCFVDNLVIVGTTYEDYATTCCDPPGTALSITGGTTVAIGNTLSLGTSGGNGGTVNWSVEAGTGAATVNSSGVVTPSSAGTVTIKAHQDANGDACPQDAEKEVTITVNVSSVSVDPTSKSIVTGETFTITPTISPSNATDKSVSWTSGTPAKATVSSTGVVTGVAAGSSTITCTTTNGSKTATCTVTVYAVTTAVKNDGGTDISASVGLPTRTGASITPADDANGYIFKEWQITNASLGSSATTKSNTITSPTGAVTLTAIYWEKKKVTWIVNGEELTSGSQSTAVAYGTQYKDLTYPSDPVVDCGDRFVGWTTSNMGSVLGQSAPTPLLTVDNRGSNTTAINADVTFYAVFADYDD